LRVSGTAATTAAGEHWKIEVAGVASQGEAFTALADPTRRAILTLLRERQPTTAGKIAEEFPEISRAAVSAHLRVLRHAELVEERRRGQFREYSLGPSKADEVVAFLVSTYSSSLSALQHSVEKKKTTKKTKKKAAG
jgi:DNA-binding transcriptional ArsR family regulator